MKGFKSSVLQWTAALLIVLAIYLIGALVIDHWVMPAYTRHNEVVEVPDVVEMPLTEADSVLQSHGFQLVKEREQYDWHYLEGTVINQNPEPLAQTKKGRRVYVTVSIGQKLSLMPNLVGKSARDAIFAAQSAGLILTEDNFGYEYSSYYPEGVVMAQSIPPGTKLKRDTPLHATVSLGMIPDEFRVPEVVGQSLERAKKSILTSGLEVGEITYQVKPDLLPHTVISQSPKPDEKTERGAFVDLTVSILEEQKTEPPEERIQLEKSLQLQH